MIGNDDNKMEKDFWDTNKNIALAASLIQCLLLGAGFFFTGKLITIISVMFVMWFGWYSFCKYMRMKLNQ